MKFTDDEIEAGIRRFDVELKVLRLCGRTKIYMQCNHNHAIPRDFSLAKFGQA